MQNTVSFSYNIIFQIQKQHVFWFQLDAAVSYKQYTELKGNHFNSEQVNVVATV